jgi:hypothetical protein
VVYAPARHPGTEGVRHPCGIVLRSLRTIRCDLGFRCRDIVVVLPSPSYLPQTVTTQPIEPTGTSDVNRWDENAGLRRDAIRSQVIDALEAQEIKETGNEEV